MRFKVSALCSAIVLGTLLVAPGSSQSTLACRGSRSRVPPTVVFTKSLVMAKSVPMIVFFVPPATPAGSSCWSPGPPLREKARPVVR